MSEDDIPNPFEATAAPAPQVNVQAKLTVRENPYPALAKNENYQLIKEEVKLAMQGDLLPKKMNFAAAVLIVQTGKVLGMTPIEALQSLYAVDGKVGMSSQTMQARVRKYFPKATLRLTRSDKEICVIEAARNAGDPVIQHEFTFEDAKKAGLTHKDNWRGYPAQMLRARATAFAVRAHWPDVIQGAMYTPEELGAITDEEGNIIATENKKPDRSALDDKYAERGRIILGTDGK